MPIIGVVLMSPVPPVFRTVVTVSIGTLLATLLERGRFSVSAACFENK